MLVTESGGDGGGGSTPGSTTPSLLDSPTLARVERARLRHEGVLPSPLRGGVCCQSLSGVGAGGGAREVHALKRGLLWQQRDRLFSRWKERYFLLTRDYLHCFKRASGPAADRISDMGQFIFKVKLVDVERVEWVNRRTYSAVVLALGREGRVLLRAAHGLEDWFELLEECTLASKERRQMLRKSHDPSWPRSENYNNNSIASNLEDWLVARHKIAGLQHLSDSVPDLQHLPPRDRNSQARRGVNMDDDDEEHWLRHRPPNHEQRLSLLTDIDINSCDMQLETPPPSVPATFRGRPTSYRLNNDVFFMSSTATSHDQERMRGTVTPSFCSSRSVLTPVGSFRSTHLFNPSKTAAERFSALQDGMFYRDRSHSDTHRLEKPNWKAKSENARRTSCLVQATQV